VQGSFEALAEENMKVLREILDAAAAAPEPAGSVTQKARWQPVLASLS
jgi:hypothetical protein